MTITDSDLDAIEARTKDATGGVWQWDSRHTSVFSSHSAECVASCTDDANTDFIAHAGGDNGDVLCLVAEVRRLRAELEKRG